MTPPQILAELEKLAKRFGVAVRFEAFDPKSLGKGGLCRLRGEPFIVIDARLPLLDKIAILSEALSTFDLEVIYLPPVLRTRLEARRPVRLPVRPPLRPPAKVRFPAAR